MDEGRGPPTVRTHKSACGIADWLAYRLTGDLTMDAALAVDSGVGALTTGQPAEAIAKKLGIDVSIFPPVSESGNVVGKMSKVAADQLGLARRHTGSQSRSRHANCFGRHGRFRTRSRRDRNRVEHPGPVRHETTDARFDPHPVDRPTRRTVIDGL